MKRKLMLEVEYGYSGAMPQGAEGWDQVDAQVALAVASDLEDKRYANALGTTDVSVLEVRLGRPNEEMGR